MKKYQYLIGMYLIPFFGLGIALWTINSSLGLLAFCLALYVFLTYIVEKYLLQKFFNKTLHISRNYSEQFFKCLFPIFLWFFCWRIVGYWGSNSPILQYNDMFILPIVTAGLLSSLYTATKYGEQCAKKNLTSKNNQKI